MRKVIEEEDLPELKSAANLPNSALLRINETKNSPMKISMAQDTKLPLIESATSNDRANAQMFINANNVEADKR